MTRSYYELIYSRRLYILNSKEICMRSSIMYVSSLSPKGVIDLNSANRARPSRNSTKLMHIYFSLFNSSITVINDRLKHINISRSHSYLSFRLKSIPISQNSCTFILLMPAPVPVYLFSNFRESAYSSHRDLIKFKYLFIIESHCFVQYLIVVIKLIYNK